MTEDLRKEPLLRKKWTYTNGYPNNNPGGVLITGANSFIGVHLVKALQEKGDRQLHLVVRAPSVSEAIRKMQGGFDQWDLGRLNPEKLSIYTGDVSKNMMGLPFKEYQWLREQVSSVVHLAMTPLYHLPYEHFKRIWIPELERMMEFCNDNRSPKALHYASSFNANFFNTDDDFKALNTNAWQSGYAGFKWVAAEAIQNAFRQGLRGCIYDIPLVIGTAEKGLCPSHYSIWMILDIFLKTGHYFPFSFRVVPVDTLAEVLVENIIAVREGSGDAFLRPVLEKPVTDKLIATSVANILGLQPADLSLVRDKCLNKLRFDFMMPDNFYELLEKINYLPAQFPAGFDKSRLPATLPVFLSNLNRIMSVRHETVKI